jgi:hypothetical protein
VLDESTDMDSIVSTNREIGLIDLICERMIGENNKLEERKREIIIRDNQVIFFSFCVFRKRVNLVLITRKEMLLNM